MVIHQFNFNQYVTPDIPPRAETRTSQAEAPVGWSGAGDWWPETPSVRPDSEMAFTQAALKGQWHAGTEHHSRTACHSLRFKGISLCDLILWDGLDVLLETSTQAQTEYVTRCDTAHFRMVSEIRSLVERVTLMIPWLPSPELQWEVLASLETSAQIQDLLRAYLPRGLPGYFLLFFRCSYYI